MEAIESARYAHSDGMGAFMCFMAVRLLAMHRVLKPTGSIYLHCDPTASHYLKAVMDAIFGWHLVLCATERSGRDQVGCVVEAVGMWIHAQTKDCAAAMFGA